MELPIKSGNCNDADHRRLVPLQNIHCSLAYIENMASRSRRRGNRLTASTESPSCSARGYRWPRRDLTNVHGRTPSMDRTRMSDTPGLGKSPPVKGTGPRRPDMDVTSTGPGHAFGRALSAIREKRDGLISHARRPRRMKRRDVSSWSPRELAGGLPQKKASSMVGHAEGLAHRRRPTARPSAIAPVLLTLPQGATPLQEQLLLCCRTRCQGSFAFGPRWNRP